MALRLMHFLPFLKRKSEVELTYLPLMSVIVSVRDTPIRFLKAMLKSVLKQRYDRIELCVAVAADCSPQIPSLLESYARKDRRVKVNFRSGQTESEMAPLAEASVLNQAMESAKGEYFAFMSDRDTLSPIAVLEVVKSLNQSPESDFIYGDEDQVSANGKISNPHFKPDYSPDMLRSCNYIGSFFVVKRNLLQVVGGFREEYEGGHRYDFILRATEKAKKILHIPGILSHARICDQEKILILRHEASRNALLDHLRRIGWEGRVRDDSLPGSFQVMYPIRGENRISIIVLNRDHAEDLSRCVEAIIRKSNYRNFEIIIAENGSVQESVFKLYDLLQMQHDFIKIIHWDKPFNYSAANNFAAQHAGGETLLFLNNDTEAINADWLERMLEHAQRKEVGIAGAKLYYPDDTIQHAGMIVGIDNAAHAHRNFKRNDKGYFGRLKIIHNLSAVTGACLMIRKEVFHEIGGFDEGYPLTYSDVDLCMKARERGYLVVWTPFAELYHAECKTRGLDDTLEKEGRAIGEVKRFREKWPGIFENGDPYYNPNLTDMKEDFSLKRRGFLKGLFSSY